GVGSCGQRRAGGPGGVRRSPRTPAPAAGRGPRRRRARGPRRRGRSSAGPTRRG
ncbi:two-component sensor histidine kinase, partial [Candidatus Frankia alpina]